MRLEYGLNVNLITRPLLRIASSLRQPYVENIVRVSLVQVFVTGGVGIPVRMLAIKFI